MHAGRWTLSITGSLLLAGCATTLSTMDTARPTPVGHVRANAAMGVYVPAGNLYDVVAAGDRSIEKIKGSGEAKLSAQEAQDLYDSAVAVALMPPALLQEFMVRTGVMEDMDVGLRYATTSLRLDAKYRFYSSESGGASQHAAVGLGVSKYLFGGAVFDALEFVKFDDFSRWDFEVPVLYSYELGDWFAFYAGAKYILTSFSYDENLYELQNRIMSEARLPDALEHRSSTMHFFGGVAGAGIGYKHVFLFAELNAGYTYTRPSMFSFLDGETKPRTLGGTTLYPSLGLVLKI